MSSESKLRESLIRIAHENPHLRKHLVPLLQRSGAADYNLAERAKLIDLLFYDVKRLVPQVRAELQKVMRPLSSLKPEVKAKIGWGASVAVPGGRSQYPTATWDVMLPGSGIRGPVFQVHLVTSDEWDSQGEPQSRSWWELWRTPNSRAVRLWALSEKHRPYFPRALLGALNEHVADLERKIQGGF